VKLKTITVPDLHGKDEWKLINPDNYDKIIFLGDYVDAPYRSLSDVPYGEPYKIDDIKINSYNGKTNAEILYNLHEVIEFKKKYLDKVILNVGNHDIPYIMRMRCPSLQKFVTCSGYRYTMASELAVLFNENFNQFQIAYQLGNVVWSHAGLTQEAYDLYFKCKLNDKFDILTEELNKEFILNSLQLYRISHLRGGMNEYGSITWADRREWNAKTYKLPFIQIVGHTPNEEILYLYEDGTLSVSVLDKKLIAVFTDVLSTKTKFFEYEVEI